MKHAGPRSSSSVFGKLLGGALLLLLKAGLALFAIATPLLGVWVASSLAAYRNGPVWATVLAGLLLFPILPVAWELLGRWRKARKRARRKSLSPEPPDVLTTSDRLILRTLALNLVFLGGLLATHPESGFTALSARGDWMLEDRTGPTAEAMRRGLFVAAGKLEWLYNAAHDNPFEKYADDAPTPTPVGSGSAGPVPTAAPLPSSSAGTRPLPAPTQPAQPDPHKVVWPMRDTLHPAVAAMPPEAEKSIASVAQYIVDKEVDPFQQVKALHDWVADRIEYDAEAYVAKRYPPQDAEAVFRSRKAVCAGYSLLLVALGKQAGRDIAYVTGDVRDDESGNIAGEGHAWNAVRIHERWYLIDATWNSGTVNGATFTKRYRTDYLLTPAEVFGLDHFPRETRWQLRDAPLSRGDFIRQPMLSPAFYAHGFSLVSPKRSQVDVQGSLEVELDNPRGRHLLASWSRSGESAQQHCQDPRRSGDKLSVKCAFPGKGVYRVRLFANDQPQGRFEYVGEVHANSD